MNLIFLSQGIFPQVSGSVKDKEKYIKITKTGNEEIKLLFAYDRIIYIENSKALTDKMLRK